MDYSLLPKIEAVPEAASMIETFRAHPINHGDNSLVL